MKLFSFRSAEVNKRVRSWVCGFVSEMRKKSPAAVQKWVDSIAVDDDHDADKIVKESPEETSTTCDKSGLRSAADEPSTSESNENLKVKLNEICNKLNFKNKKLEFKNLLAKTTQKLKRESSVDRLMEQRNDDDLNDIKEEDEPVVGVVKDEINPEMNNLTVQRCHIGLLGRSSSENPSPSTTRNRRLNEIGRSFSVANENELPTVENSSENLIYDADEDISITIPSLNTSPSNNTNVSSSNSHLGPVKANLLQTRPLREHTVSEGHQSPQVTAKNPLLRDSSFQVRLKVFLV